MIHQVLINPQTNGNFEFADKDSLSSIKSFGRFCKHFSESSPCLPRHWAAGKQHNNCGTLRIFFYKTLEMT